MELYRRKIGYQDIGRTANLVVTATTIYLPIFLTQSFEDIGIYTDTNNPIIEVVTGLTGVWNTTGNTGSNEKPCLVLNNCGVGTPTITSPSYYGGWDGKIQNVVINGSNCVSPQTFQWSGPNGYVNTTNLDITGLRAGNYVLKITDKACDISYHTFVVTQPQYLSNSVTQTNSQVNDINGTCNGSASVNPTGGNPPYIFSWFINSASTWVNLNLTASTVTGLCAGSYMVQVKDSPPVASDATIVSSFFNITEPTALSGDTITTINIDCNGDNTGYIQVKGVGGVLTTGYTYTLSPGSIVNYSGIFENLVANSYTVTVTDNVGSNYNITPITITQPVVVGGVITPISNAGCYGDNLGSFTVTPSGGVGPYSILIYRNGGLYDTVQEPTSYTITDLFASVYTVDIADSNGCTVNTLTQTIYHRDEFLMSVNKPQLTNGFDIACYSATTQITATTTLTTLDAYTLPTPAGNIEFYVDGVYNGYCYHSVGSGCYAVLTGIVAGNHTITSVSNVGCSATTLVSITQPPMDLSINYGIIESVTGNTGIVSGSTVVTGTTQVRQGVIDINGGVSPYTITWSDGSTLLTSDIHAVGTVLTVSVTDDNGCSVGPINITLTP